MANKKISQLPLISAPLSSDDLFEVSIDNGGGVSYASKSAKGQDIKNLVGAVTAVTAVSPVVSSGGTNPAISMGVASSLSNGYLANSDWTSFNNKQPTLVSGTNIKTINSNTILGAGDIAVQPTLVSGTNIKTVNGASILGSGNINAGRSRVAQAPTTLANQYIAAAGVGMSMLFSANVISTQGQIIDLDFLARNNSGVNSIMRVYVNSSATLSGASQIANFSFGSSTDQMMRMTRRLVVIRDSLSTNNWFLIGADGLGYNTDIVYTAGQLYNPYSLGSSTILEKTFIIVALNQQSSLIAASIEY